MIVIPEIDISLFISDLAADTPAISKPVKVLGNDLNEYYLKNEKIFDAESKKFVFYNSSFINEFFSYCIGKHIGVPQPSIAVANLRSEFLEATPELKFNNRFDEGKYFSTNFLEGSTRNLVTNYEELLQAGKPYLSKTWNKFFKDIENPNDVPLIIAFDFLIGNLDRFAHPDNFLLINTPNPGSKKTLYAIDQGHAFGGPIWDVKKMAYLHNQNTMNSNEYIQWFVNEYVLYNQRNLNSNIFNLNGFGDIFKALNQYIDVSEIDSHNFIQPMNKISTITGVEIDYWLSQIPNEWFVEEDKQKNFYKEFLLNQIQLLPNIIQYVASTGGFENYRGGLLQWQHHPQAGIQ